MQIEWLVRGLDEAIEWMTPLRRGCCAAGLGAAGVVVVVAACLAWPGATLPGALIALATPFAAMSTYHAVEARLARRRRLPRVLEELPVTD